jgi:predicted small lipoprotein YifL
MTKRIVSLLMIAVLVIGLLAACDKDGPLDAEDAKKVVLADMGLKERQVDSLDVHMSPMGESMAYAVYVTVDDHHWVYMVDGLSGEILQKTETDSGHSH